MVASSNRKAAIRLSGKMPSSLLGLDLDRPGLDLELGGGPVERLPRGRLALGVGRGDLVGQRAVGIVGRDDPDGRPEMIGGRAIRRMRPKGRLYLLAVGYFDRDALQS